jgi:hypothetical protein
MIDDGLTMPTVLSVCYATQESMGNTADDFIALPQNVTQLAPPTFGPNRTVTGAQQQLRVFGGHAGDSVGWTQASDCVFPDGAAGTATQTRVYSVTSHDQEFMLHASASPGDWIMCLKSHATGIWTVVTGQMMVVEPSPSSWPPVGIAGSITPLQLTGVQDGDLIVLQEHDCSNAHNQSTSESSLMRTVVADMRVSTVLDMTKATTLKVCYATRDSVGDSPDDYIELGTTLEQRQPISFWPQRTVRGAAQHLNLSFTRVDDVFVWSRESNCSTVAVEGGFDSRKTMEYIVTIPGQQAAGSGSGVGSGSGSDVGSTASAEAIYAARNNSVAFELHRSASAGDWYTCHKPAGGVWTLVTGST